MDDTPAISLDEQVAETYAPSVFEQAAAIAKEENLVPLSNAPTQEQPVTIDKQDVADVCETLFDIPAFFTKCDQIGLTEKEKERLARLWLKPINRLLAKYPNADITIALTVTIPILLEKYFAYQIAIAERRSAIARDNSRDEGMGKDKLDETEIARGVTPFRN